MAQAQDQLLKLVPPIPLGGTEGATGSRINSPAVERMEGNLMWGESITIGKEDKELIQHEAEQQWTTVTLRTMSNHQTKPKKEADLQEYRTEVDSKETISNSKTQVHKARMLSTQVKLFLSNQVLSNKIPIALQ